MERRELWTIIIKIHEYETKESSLTQIRYIQIGNSREIMSPFLMRMRDAVASVMHIFY